MTDAAPPMTDVPLLPGADVLKRVRRLVIVTIAAAVTGGAFLNASRSGCSGGFDADGGFVDAAGQSVDTAPDCASMTLSPSPLFYVLLALTVLWTISAVVRRTHTEAAAIRLIDRVALVIIIATAAGIVISQVWFALTPLPDPGGSWTVFSPFPFGTIEVDTYPMTP